MTAFTDIFREEPSEEVEKYEREHKYQNKKEQADKIRKFPRLAGGKDAKQAHCTFECGAVQMRVRIVDLVKCST